VVVGLINVFFVVFLRQTTRSIVTLGTMTIVQGPSSTIVSGSNQRRDRLDQPVELDIHERISCRFPLEFYYGLAIFPRRLVHAQLHSDRAEGPRHRAVRAKVARPERRAGQTASGPGPISSGAGHRRHRGDRLPRVPTERWTRTAGSALNPPGPIAAVFLGATAIKPGRNHQRARCPDRGLLSWRRARPDLSCSARRPTSSRSSTGAALVAVDNDPEGQPRALPPQAQARPPETSRPGYAPSDEKADKMGALEDLFRCARPRSR